MKPRLVVIGSANRDLVVRADRIPEPGETVVGGAFTTAPGGKGANQAVAAARLGADVWFVGRVGKDPFGDSLITELHDAGIHTEFLVRDDTEATGVALIGVDARGQNAIIVSPGANSRLTSSDIKAARETIAQAFAVIIQLEIPFETVTSAIEVASAAGTRVIVNPAPVQQSRPFPNSLLAKIDVLTPNEHEACQLLGLSLADVQQWDLVAEQLLRKGPRTIVITLGDNGCLIADAGGCRKVPATSVRAIDTTAAGDCFTGALAVALAEGESLDTAAVFANRAAAVSVTRNGAQPSLPFRTDLN